VLPVVEDIPVVVATPLVVEPSADVACPVVPVVPCAVEVPDVESTEVELISTVVELPVVEACVVGRAVVEPVVICSPVVLPVVTTPVVTGPVVSGPVVMTPVVSTPVVMTPVVACAVVGACPVVPVVATGHELGQAPQSQTPAASTVLRPSTQFAPQSPELQKRAAEMYRETQALKQSLKQPSTFATP